MQRVFIDEAGDFNFKDDGTGTKFFILTALTVPDDSELAGSLNDLRHELSFVDEHLQDRVFHATVDFQSTRDRVYQTLLEHQFEVHATIVDKRTLSCGDSTDIGCYLTAWSKHMGQIPFDLNDTLITAASVFTGGKYRGLKGVRAAMLEAVDVHAGKNRELAIVPCYADPLLQAADYCCWAIQRWHERGDARSYEIIAEHISSETVWPHAR